MSSSNAPSNLLDTSDFERINEDLRKYDEQRENIIKRSRDIQKLAKQAIFSLHRGDDGEASTKLITASGIANELLPIIVSNPYLRPGSFSSAMEEYAEAVVFRGYLQEGRLVKLSEIPVAEIEEYLGGVLDFTGELNRFAIARATVRDVAEVKKCRDLVEAIMGQFLQFDLRNGSIRKKYDGLKYTLKKLENTLYELSLTQAGMPTKPSSMEDEPGEQEDKGAAE